MRTTFSGEKLAQSEYELSTLILRLQEHNCQSWLEIGARHGDTFYEIVTKLPKGSKAVAVDLPEAAWGKPNSLVNLERCRDELNRLGYDVHVIVGDSTSVEVIEQVCTFGPFDAGLIDGDHRYEGVKKDWRNYKEQIAKIIAFHDIDGDRYVHPANESWVLEVPVFWKEVKQDRHFEEIIDSSQTAKMGIGLIYK